MPREVAAAGVVVPAAGLAPVVERQALVRAALLRVNQLAAQTRRGALPLERLVLAPKASTECRPGPRTRQV
jgi:hypothetical protein